MKTLIAVLTLSISLLAQTQSVVSASKNNPVSITGSVTCNGGTESGSITFKNTSSQPIMALYAVVNTYCVAGGNRILYRHDQYFKHGPLAIGDVFEMPVEMQTDGTPVQPKAATVEIQAVQFADGTWWGDPSFPPTIQDERIKLRNFLQQLVAANTNDFNTLLENSKMDSTLHFMSRVIRMANDQAGIASARAKAQDYLDNANSRSF